MTPLQSAVNVVTILGPGSNSVILYSPTPSVTRVPVSESRNEAGSGLFPSTCTVNEEGEAQVSDGL